MSATPSAGHRPSPGHAAVAEAERAIRLAATDPATARALADAVLATLAAGDGSSAGLGWDASPYGAQDGLHGGPERWTDPPAEDDRAEGRACPSPGGERAAQGPEVAAVAYRALALAARELGDLPLAEEHLLRSVRLAVAAGSLRRAAQARLSLVPVQTELGRPEQALALAREAEPYLTPSEIAMLGVNRASALMRLGRHDDAIRHCDHAVDVLGEDQVFLAGALLNRGIARVYLEDFTAAEADLRRSAELARAAGLTHVLALAEGNLPFLAARRGDLPAAFAAYLRAERSLFGCPERLATVRCDLAQALIAAHLPGEARALLDLAVPELEAAGAATALAEARLTLAEVELRTGDAHRALVSAELARSELLAHGRCSSVPLATEIVLRAHLRLAFPGTPTPFRARPAAAPDDAGKGGEPGQGAGERLLAEMTACADDLDRTGHPSGPLRLTVAELAIRLGDDRTAGEQLALPALAGNGVAAHRAAALRRVLRGDRRGAFAAILAGLTRAGARASWLARTAIRDGAALRGATGTDGTQASAAGIARPDTAGTADTGGMPTGETGTADAGNASVAGIGVAWAGGTEVPPEAGAGEDPAVRAQAVREAEPLAALGLALALETGRGGTVLAWAERCRGVAGGAGRPVAPPLGELRAALGERALVEFVRHGDELVAVAIVSGRVTLCRLGPFAAAAEATVRLRYGLRRTHLRDGPATGTAGEAAAVERLVLGPLLGRLGDRPLVVVPAGALHTLPWPVLPSNAERPVTIAASAAAWLTAHRAENAHPAGAVRQGEAAHRAGAVRQGHASAGGRTVVVAGPRLRHAGDEADMVRDRRPGAERVPADRAAVMAALERAAVAHLAAHGTFCARSPLLSGIDLDDGRLMAYDLLRLRTPPDLVVLSACDTGMAHAPADGAPLGLAGTFLSLGTRCVVAGLVPVRDEETLALMTAFHTLLAAGHPPAAALTRASAATGVSGFACFGYGDQPVATGREGSVTQWDQEPA
ncbi:CHAT domain-containing protein [Planobispora takensis]|uniref:CHAT domain-containing protein n=1 Tax=Planobispora takensis TaxID=1367882 RepID=A0A8J3WSC7_9ACTN|nr:CHAT domain-containing tetratricopeptide repeat protein [Planobispora takensis]GII00519.1 CHAT domain-containing protein [Planobispora takensis]